MYLIFFFFVFRTYCPLLQTSVGRVLVPEPELFDSFNKKTKNFFGSTESELKMAKTAFQPTTFTAERNEVPGNFTGRSSRI